MRRIGLTAGLLGLATFATGSTARAHLELVSPVPRTGGRAAGPLIKNGPCGQLGAGRTDQVTVFEPGSTITVTWDEFINHPSYYRIAFDIDGDDGFPLRADPDGVTQAGDDPAAEIPVGDVVLQYVMTDGPGGMLSTQVTLPDVECSNCTLQVIQFMYDKLGNGTNDEYYFQCADITLMSTTGGTTGGTGTSTDSGTGAATSAVDPGGSDTGASSPGAADGGGCSVAEEPRPLHPTWMLAAFGAVLVGRRRRLTTR